MPVCDELVPAWFRSAVNMLRSCDISKYVQGAIIMPLLNEKARTLVANRAEERVLSYEVCDLILQKLKLTHEKCKHFFIPVGREMRPWGSSSVGLRSYLTITFIVGRSKHYRSYMRY